MAVQLVSSSIADWLTVENVMNFSNHFVKEFNKH